MGNVPLASPPRPTAHRVVLPITTKRRFSSTLLVQPPLLNYQESPERTAIGAGRNASVAPSETAATRPEINTEEMTLEDSLPPQLRESPISAQEYKEKMQQLKECLSEWKGGRASLVTLLVSVSVILAFVGAFFTPSFWRSRFFDHPGYICAIGISILSGFALLARYNRKQTQRLVQDVNDLYRPWRGRGVHVSMKQFAAASSIYSQGRKGHGSDCFCLVMNIANENEDQDDGDNFSVGTVMTDDSRESGNDEEENETEEVIVDDPSDNV